MKSEVISKKRVADYGEVLTGKREVNAMLDLVKEQTEFRVQSSTFSVKKLSTLNA